MKDEGNHLFLELTEEEFEDANEGNIVFNLSAKELTYSQTKPL